MVQESSADRPALPDFFFFLSITNFGGSGFPLGMNFIEMELTQWRVFLGVNRSPWKT